MRQRLLSTAWVWIVVALMILAESEATVWADDIEARQASSPSEFMCVSSASSRGELEGVQIETSDIGLHERFFSQVLHAREVQRIDHPQVDFLRGYCYRNMLIVVRQDVRTPRPTGWVQVNFSIADVAELQHQLEQALRESDVAQLDDAERAKVVRFRLKSDVSRNNCRAARLEVNGPEGFMIGFDQFKEGSCKTEETQTQSESGEHDRPHHQ
jgi:hypothetical protein